MKYTNTGRVVYKRKKHYLGVLDVVRQCEAISIRLSREELAKNPYACNALFEIVRTAFYPTWQRASNLRTPTVEDIDFYRKVENQLRLAWQRETFNVCREIGEDLEIPGYIITFVMNYLATWVWDTVWTLTDPFFTVY